jgi:hypothetical protein
LSKDKYIYDNYGMKGARVGQAVSDILSKPQPSYTVEDILSEYGNKYALDLEKTIENNKKKYKSPFYVFVLTKKEFWTDNVVRNWFIARQTPPHGSDMMKEYPHHTKTLYVVDTDNGNLRVVWTLPGYEDCKSILKTPDSYDKDLVKWVLECFGGSLDKNSYDVVCDKTS